MERYRQVWNKLEQGGTTEKIIKGFQCVKNRVKTAIEAPCSKGALQKTITAEGFSFFGTRAEQGKIKRV